MTARLVLAAILTGTAVAETNTWTRLDKATITGQRREPPLVYSPEVGGVSDSCA